jgi:tRNA dimethylallyltransferase
VAPTEAYSAGRFKRDAQAAMTEIAATGRTPLLVGGTMLYFKALAGHLDDLPQAAPALRAELEARGRREGWPALHADLTHLDPATAARLKPNDSQRIQRALEVCLTTGGPMSALLGASPAEPPPWLQVALIPADRLWLHARINLRFRLMLEQGLVQELDGLRHKYVLNPALPSMRCVGYRQAWAYLEGELDDDALYDQGAAATRQLAKRQLTWLRSWQGACNVDCAAPEMRDQVARLVEEALAVKP